MATDRAKYTTETSNKTLCTSDKGLKKPEWKESTLKMNNRLSVTLDKDLYKSKITRLMQDYDLYKKVVGLSGGGVCPTTEKPKVETSVWDRLIEAAAKKNKPKLKTFRKFGFVHLNVCSQIAGDTRATGAEGETPYEVVQAVATATPSTQSTNAMVSSTGALAPPSDVQRHERVKRYRNGATKSNQVRDSKSERDDMMRIMMEYEDPGFKTPEGPESSQQQ